MQSSKYWEALAHLRTNAHNLAPEKGRWEHNERYNRYRLMSFHKNIGFIKDEYYFMSDCFFYKPVKIYFILFLHSVFGWPWWQRLCNLNLGIPGTEPSPSWGTAGLSGSGRFVLFWGGCLGIGKRHSSITEAWGAGLGAHLLFGASLNAPEGDFLQSPLPVAGVEHWSPGIGRRRREASHAHTDLNAIFGLI